MFLRLTYQTAILDKVTCDVQIDFDKFDILLTFWRVSRRNVVCDV
jgi:hypothetical protein